MDSNTRNVTTGLVRAILILTDEQRRSINVQSVCQYIYCKFSINEFDDPNATCHVTSERLTLSDKIQIEDKLSFNAVAIFIRFYIYPIFIFMGIFGNTLACFIMFLNVRRNGYSSNLYLTLLAFIDCLFLLGSALPEWIFLVHDQTNIKLLSEFSCRFIYWFGNFTTHLSAGLVISVTIERFIAIKYPLIAHKINTIKYTHMTLIILIIFFFLLDSRVFILLKYFHESIHVVLKCQNNTDIKYERRDIVHCSFRNETNEQIWLFIDFSVYTLIPFLIIVTLNSLIIHRLINAQRLRQRMSHYDIKSINEEQKRLYRNLSDNHQLNLEKCPDLRRCKSVPERRISTIMLRPPINQSQTHYNTRQSNESTESSIRFYHGYQASIINHKTNTNNVRLTILLIFISGSFLALTLPAVVLNLIISIKLKSSPSTFEDYLHSINNNQNKNAFFYYAIGRLLMIMNHSINCILYFVVGKRFRQDLKILCVNYWRYLSRK